ARHPDRGAQLVDLDQPGPGRGVRRPGGRAGPTRHRPGPDRGRRWGAVRPRAVAARALTPGADVALCSHGHLLRILTACWIGLPPTDGRVFALATASASVPGWGGGTPVLQG